MSDKISVCLVAPVPPPYGGIANWYNHSGNQYGDSSYNLK